MSSHGNSRWGFGLLLAIALLLSLASAWVNASNLDTFLASTRVEEIFPGADRIQAPENEKFPVASAWSGKQMLGHVFLNSDFVNAAGYSARPIHILMGMANDGRLVGLKLVKHDEPIVLIGIAIERIHAFIDGYLGLNFVQNPPQSRMQPPVDIISGATVTLMVIGDSITRASMIVAQKLEQATQAGAASAVEPARIDPDASQTRSWQELLDDGAVRRLQLTVGEVNEAFTKSGNPEAALHPESDDPEDRFIDLIAAQVSVPAIGRSLLGDALWQQLQERLAPGQQAILVAGNGAYSFKGSGYVRGGIFDRVEILQGPQGFRFRDRNHQRLADLMAEGAPSFREVALFTVPEDQAFDAIAPWRLQLLVQRTLSVKEKAFLSFDLDYQVPQRYLIVPAAQAEPAAATTAAPPAADDTSALWEHMWRAKAVQIGVLLVALLVLTSVFFFQNWFARHPVLYARFRIAYLLFTLFWLGGYCVAQLSVVNVLTFTHALRTGFHWEYFLMDPVVFILWCATAVSGLLWNRGAFCGWLCPFGSLQELMNRAARKLGVRQVKVPFSVHERLAALKYIIFLALFAFSLYDLGFAERMAEVEPFKTAIILRFMRHWPYVLFAVLVLFAGLFIERFYCRYLCPLGAALAIPARLRLFDWLRRYKECGNPCQRCAVECPVEAIHPEGHINPNECIQCLNCQVLYHHEQKCPHLIKKNARRARKPAPDPVPLQAQDLARGQARPGARVVARTADAVAPDIGEPLG